jgi:ABC-type Fe3+/spermidine/putrescine transport system ATPase subunit
MTFLQLSNISLRYGNTPALLNTNLDISTSELITLVGPSGCGKSTLLRVVAGLLTPQEGQVSLDGRDITGLSPEQRRMGWVPQNYALFEHLNVFNNVAFGLRHKKLLRQDITKQVEAMLELCRITSLASRRVADLSGGQKQRVAVARALAIKPRLLLLDEPLAALDPQLRSELRGGLQQLIKESGVTTLFVTHDQTEALSLADRVVVMREGTVEQFAKPETLWSRPASSFVAQFFGSATVLKTRRVNAQQLELLPGLCVALPGTHEPEIALRRHDLEPAPQGARVTVLGSEYLGDSYTVQTRHASGTLLYVRSGRQLNAGESICVNVPHDYHPTLLGETDLDTHQR